MQHTYWLADEQARSLEHAVRLSFPPEADVRLDRGLERPADLAGLAAGQVPLTPDEMREMPSVVLLAPDLDERDRVQEALAGWERTRLEIIDDPAPEIHAERTLALLLALALRIVESDAAIRESSPDTSALVTGQSGPPNWLGLDEPSPLIGQRLGILGFRSMGRALAVRAAALGMVTLYWTDALSKRERQEVQTAALQSGAVEAPFDRLLRFSDFIVIDVGFEEGMQRLIDAPELALMREGALLVNTTNGRAIDEGALIQALRGGYLGGVALDVFNYEPLPTDSPLRDLDRVLLGPHIAQPSDALVQRMMAGRLAKTLLGLSGSQDLPRRVRHVVRRRE